MNITQKPISTGNWSFKDSYKAGICFHWIVGNLYSAGSTFNNPNRKASAHFGVGDLPGEVHQYVAVNKVAYHAGDSDSFWENGYFIGIEHSGGEMQANDQRRIPSDQCVQNSIDLCVDICRKQGWDRLVLPYSYDLLNQDPTALIEQYRGQRVGIAIRHRNVANTGTACSGSLGVEYIVEQVNRILSGNQTIPVINVNNNIMTNEKLIEVTKNNTQPNTDDQNLLLASIYSDDAAYFANFSGFAIRKDLEKIQAENIQLKNQLNDLPVPVKIFPTDEELNSKGYISLIEAQKIADDKLQNYIDNQPKNSGVGDSAPVVTVPTPIIDIKKDPWRWLSRKFIAWLGTSATIVGTFPAYTPVLSVAIVHISSLIPGLKDAINYEVAYALVTAVVGFILFVHTRLYLIVQGKEDASKAPMAVMQAWQTMISQIPSSLLKKK